MIVLRMVILASSVALSMPTSHNHFSSQISQAIGSLSCKALFDNKAQECIAAKLAELKLDQHPGNICKALTKEFYLPCMSKEQKHCVDTKGDFEHAFKAVKKLMPPEMRGKC